ncbi:hypothetical protein ETD83_05785 [Actinomadura soli]|uniref:Uncharacterized protein n=1 Tax=Actinomadura soli TaxID=2508997 RepID=A0A5C4JHD2_9ACTN|nr:hypothetical protein [Actinomadura soli]TMR05643.1 hypothetical protein ETD83_05785 [Actinomadura soli]
MDIQQLGYTGLNSTGPAAFRSYATDVLGLAEVRSDTGRTGFRMDSFEQRIIIEPSDVDGGAYYGWQLGSGDELRAAATSAGSPPAATSSSRAGTRT